MQIQEITVAPGFVSSDLDERRRVGRVDIAPSLVPLLRLSSDGRVSFDAMREALRTEEQMTSFYVSDAESAEPARGFLVALCMAIPFWMIVAAVTYYSF